MANSDKGLMRAVGLRVRKLRRDAEMSQASLAEEAGIHANYLGAIERAEQTPSVEVLAKIVNALGKKMSDFFAEIGE